MKPFCNETGMQLALQGRALCAILTQPGSTEEEKYAAAELAAGLQRITGAEFEVRECSSDASQSAIIIGNGPLADELFPDANIASLANEEIIIRTNSNRLLLAGEGPSGTLYAVYGFLQDYCGVRWWTQWADYYPANPDLSIGQLDVREKPAFGLRNVFWFGTGGEWMARNRCSHGEGDVHTFFLLVPPDEYFEKHPEWFSLIDGTRRHPEGEKHRSQLCTTNPQLREFLVERVRQQLTESPDTSMISISQDDTYPDWSGACECPDCKVIDEREGTHAGTMIELVNFVANRLGPEFPHVSFDTLAYRYTRKAPKTVRPLPNVIVRLCSIECNFAEPFDDPSNQSFAQDIEEWSNIGSRLYVWDYTTNFAHYVLPHPNWFALGPNVRFFNRHGVWGLFEQGAYQSYGAEMGELRPWLLAQLLWNPSQDDKALIHEFLEGYYGKSAAVFIHEYLQLMYEATKGLQVTIFDGPDSPYLNFEVMQKAELLWQKAEAAVQNDPDLLWRVRQGHMPVWYTYLTNWSAFRKQCEDKQMDWPISDSIDDVANEWLSSVESPGPVGWKQMTHIGEGGQTPQDFIASLTSHKA